MTRHSRLITAILLGVVVLNIVDLVLHVATNQIEMLRVIANSVVFLACGLIVTVGRRMTRELAVFGAIATLTLNSIVIVTDGLGPAGFVFVGLTVIALVVVAFLAPRATTND